MAVGMVGGYVEIFKFAETGWFALFEEVLDFRKTEAAAGREYRVIGVGQDSHTLLYVRLVEEKG